MSDDKPLVCECGVQAFRNIQFPEPGVMHATCFHCGSVKEIGLSAMAAEAAWERMEREAPEPKAEKPEKPIGYKYEPML